MVHLVVLCVVLRMITLRGMQTQAIRYYYYLIATTTTSLRPSLIWSYYAFGGIMCDIMDYNFIDCSLFSSPCVVAIAY